MHGHRGRRGLLIIVEQVARLAAIVANVPIRSASAPIQMYPKTSLMIAMGRPSSPVRRVCANAMWPKMTQSGPVGRKTATSARIAMVFVLGKVGRSVRTRPGPRRGGRARMDSSASGT